MRQSIRFIFCLFLFFLSGRVGAQEAVSGVVTDAETNEALPGVNVFVKGTTHGTPTDSEGVYKIWVKPGDRLVFSFIGYAPLEVIVGENTSLSVKLQPDAELLSDVIITGYSIQSKKSSTGAVSTLSSEELKKMPVVDVTQALQGRISGVTVSGQGGPGATQVVRIRGFGSLGDNDPLYVVDGVQTKIGINQINPSDIESITVLKDPSTAALYGSRGANGVIVITTKKGANAEPKVSYSAFAGVQYIPKRRFPDVLSPKQLADVVWEGKRNAIGFSGTFSHPIYLNGSQPIIPAYIIPLPIDMPTGIDESKYQYITGNVLRYTRANQSGTNWFDVVFDPGILQNHQVAINGGNDKSSYNVSFTYTDENGAVKYTDFKRYSFHTHTDFKLRSWLKVGGAFNTSFSTVNSFPSQSRQGPLVNAYLMPEIFPVYDVGGHLTGPNGLAGIFTVDNPLFGLKNGNDNLNQSIRVFGAPYFEIEPVHNLSYRTQIAVDYLSNHYNYFLPSTAETTLANATGSLGEGTTFVGEWRWLNKVAYKYKIRQHDINAFAAVEASTNNARFLEANKNGFLYNNVDYRYFNAAPNLVSTTGSGTKSALYSVFGNIDYSYKGRYFASGVIRRDGSSKFGRNNRFGVFPSLGTSWLVSEENFMKPQIWINHLKVKASWGRVGNEAIDPAQTISRFATDALYANFDISGTNTNTSAGLIAIARGNANLKWETNETLDFGLEAKIIENKVQVNIDWYKRDTRDLLYAPPASSTINGGLLPTAQNVLSFVNKGLDIEATYFGNPAPDFSFDIGLNFSTYRNEVTKLSPGVTFINGASILNNTLARHVVGQPLGLFYGFEQGGIYQNVDQVNGSVIIAEANPAEPQNLVGHFWYRNIDETLVAGRQVINNEDRSFIGNPHPDFTYGINLTARYKKFDLNLFFQGVQGNEIFNWFKSVTDFPNGGTTNYSSRVLNSWRADNTGASLPIIQDGNNFNDNRISSYFVEDGSYLRLKNVQLGYTLNGLAGINNFKVYLQGQNLLTFTGYSGIDPEVSSGNPGTLGVDYGNNYPIAAKILIGVSLEF